MVTKLTKTTPENKPDLLKEGSYPKDQIEIVQGGKRSKKDISAIADALKSGNVWVFSGQGTRHTNYNTRKRLEKEYGIKNVKFGHDKKSKQSIIYV